MAYGTAIRQGLRIAARIDQKYNINKIFVQKYVPPGYRNVVNKIFDIVGTAGGGYGLYSGIQSLIAPDSPGNQIAIPQKKLRISYKTRTSYKTRRRLPRCPSSRYKQNRNSYQYS